MPNLATRQDDDGLPPDLLPATWFEPEDEEPVEVAVVPQDRLLDVHAAAAYCGVHENTVYEAAKSGALACRRIGRLRRFTVADLDAWTGGGA